MGLYLDNAGSGASINPDRTGQGKTDREVLGSSVWQDAYKNAQGRGAPAPSIRDPKIVEQVIGKPEYAQKPAPKQEQPAPAFNGDFDLTQPGYAEQWWNQNGDWFTQNHRSDSAYDSYLAALSDPTQVEDYWKTVSGHAGQGPGLDPYYDQAYRTGSNRINQELAARGQYGSSAGMNQLTNLATGLGAEQANREADYRLASDLGYGQLAGAASSAKMGRAGAGMSAALQADSADLSRMTAGMTGATTAQGMRERRIGNAYDDMLGMARSTAPITQDAYLEAFNNDEGLLGEEENYNLATFKEKVNQILGAQTDNMGKAQFIMDMIATFKGGGGGGGGMFGGGGGGGGSKTGAQLGASNGYTPAGEFGSGGVTVQDVQGY